MKSFKLNRVVVATGCLGQVRRAMRRVGLVLSLAALGCWGSVAQAALHDRGGGLLYDDVLNVTWLQDADYVVTSGFAKDNAIDWANANRWVKDLVYHDPVRNVDITGWRLPKVRPIDGKAFTGKFSVDGSSDEGYNIVSPNSEMAYMFHVNLGLKSYYDKTGMVTKDFGAGRNGKEWAKFETVGPVKNLRSSIYWTGTPCPPYFNAWQFHMGTGCQNFYNQWDRLCVWAVHDGDVTAQPKPAK